ncbi:MAG TPA: hypothetical protein VGY55_07115 [Pirellulales bacterium]|nr:hypothetical protein [Pirellulales bacterium]
MIVTLTPEQEAQARQLAEQLKQQAQDPFLAIARLLVVTDERTLFGATEFAIRKHALELISKAYALHLGQKKTATAVRRSPVRSAGKRRLTTASGNVAPNASAE